jgi:dienelactone hydrolase
MRHVFLLCASFLILSSPASSPSVRADDFVQQALSHSIIGPRQSLLDLQDHLEPRIPRLGRFETVGEFEAWAKQLRQDLLTRVVLRGQATRWRDAPLRVEWKDSLPGEGYRIRKLRYEVVPGLWIPALLYEPENRSGKAPVVLAVNGHERMGKAVDYKQIRCINLAKRGLLVLNVEWFGMGQLRSEGFVHYRMNQLDLCGTSGLAPFYLALTRGLDVLLARPEADPARVAVSGLSGGGWQTIVVSALDTRVTLANPVAGYSSFRVRIRDHYKDLGDSEQTPSDLATLADYTHLTALRAPRPTLLTYNSKDNCCFESGYALPPLLDAAGPIYRLFGKDKALRSHVNHDPGDHNYGKDNRQAFYRMVGDFFHPDDRTWKSDEIPCEREIKSADELAVELPAANANFNTLALGLSRGLPRTPRLPDNQAGALAWQEARRKELREVTRAPDLAVKVLGSTTEKKDGTQATFWKLRLGDTWTVPVVELTRGEARGTTLVLNDAGRKVMAKEVEQLLGAGQRVLALDPFYFGESKVQSHDFLFALLLACVGDRPLGVQAAQIGAVSRWATKQFGTGAVTVLAVGPRLGLGALVAGAMEVKAIGRVEIQGSLGTLREVIEQSRSVDQMPELFCFGLLEATDVRQMAALVAPRPVVLIDPSERARKQLAGLSAWYRLLGRDHDPLKR